MRTDPALVSLPNEVGKDAIDNPKTDAEMESSTTNPETTTNSVVRCILWTLLNLIIGKIGLLVMWCSWKRQHGSSSHISFKNKSYCCGNACE